MSMDKFVGRVQRFCLRAIGTIGALIFLFLTVYSWRYTVRHYWENVYFDTKDNVLVTALVFLATCFGIGLIGKLVENCPKKLMLIIAVLVSIAMTVVTWIFINTAKPYTVGDQAWLQVGATALAEGEIDIFRGDTYYSIYGYQLYLIDLFALLFRLFGTSNPILIYRVQAVLTGLATFAVFGITRELFQSRKAEMLSLLCVLVFFPMRLYAAYFYGETLGLCAALYAIWVFIKMNREETIKPYRAIVCGVLLGLFFFLTFLAREALLIIGIAMCIIQFFLVIKNKRYWLLAVFGISLAICFGGRFLHGESLERRTGISQNQSAPSILCVVIGFQDSNEEGMAAGTYNGYNIRIFEECGYDVEAASRRAKQDLQNRFQEWMKTPADILSFIKNKILIQWNEPVYGSIGSTMYYGGTEEWLNKIYGNRENNRLIDCLKQYQAILYLFLLGGFIMLIKKPQDTRQYLIGLILIGGFLFSLIWEAKNRYIYPYAVIAIPFAAGSAVDLVDRLAGWAQMRKHYLLKQRWQEGGWDMRFTKMEGCGNDYIYVNGFEEKIPAKEKPELVRRLSDRHFGIGGDGLIFINPAKDADFEMEMYNADGSRAEMCGNGIRCVGKFVYDNGLTNKEHITVVSAGKIKYLDLIVEKDNKNAEGRGRITSVRVNMGSPVLTPAQIPVIAEGDRVVDEPIQVDGREYRMTCVSMGNPHAVVFAKDVAGMKLSEIGPKFENHERFPNRTNTEFVEVVDRQTVFMRVWERGTGETLACGTGCCATAVACILNGLTDDKVTVKLLGGELVIEWDREKDLVYMTGPATTVFEGEVEITK